MSANIKTANENVIRALSRALAEARAGNIEAVAIVAVSPDGVPDCSFGGETELMPSVNLGVDMFKANLIMQTVTLQQRPVSSIVRPASGGTN